LNGGAGPLDPDRHDGQWRRFFEYRGAGMAGTPRATPPAGARSTTRTWTAGGSRVTIGYEHTFVHAATDFLKGVEAGTPAEPTFRTALSTQRVCDAILQSAKSGQWVETVVAG
jgi:predicted dehydrogenase